jgi:hypothetical protein
MKRAAVDREQIGHRDPQVIQGVGNFEAKSHVLSSGGF